MQKKTTLQFRFLVFGLLLLSGLAVAQDTATLTGTVRDNTGAVIPGAAVAIKNTATGIVRNFKTNSAGEYPAAGAIQHHGDTSRIPHVSGAGRHLSRCPKRSH